MSMHVKPAPRPQSLLGAWHAHVATTAKQRPWLVREMLRRKQELLPKFAECYRRLRALPRSTRRMLYRKWACSLAGAALLLAFGQGHAVAANFTAGNATELNDAISVANSTVEADTISLTADIVLTTVADSSDGDSGTVAVSSALTIEGNDHTIARDLGAPEFFRVLTVNSAGTLTVRETTLSGGNAFLGGGLLNRGRVTLEGCTVSGNSASLYGGGISSLVYGSSQVTLSNSTISGNTATFGGGVQSRASDNSTVTLSNSTISGNTATFGGGVSNRIYGSSQMTLTNSTVSGNSARYGGGGSSQTSGSSQVTLTNSTVSGNTTSLSGGGVWIDAFGSSQVTLANSTVSGNTASLYGGGIRNVTGGSSQVTLSNSTISDNTATLGGGVWNRTDDSSQVTLQRLLVVGNTAPTGAEVYWSNFGGTFTVNDHNLFGNSGLTNAQAFFGFAPGATDLTATSDGSDPTALTDILDTTLQNNGGLTQTHALIAGSPGIDASPADADCQATDQRGVSRPQGVACDIGVFEFTPRFVATV